MYATVNTDTLKPQEATERERESAIYIFFGFKPSEMLNYYRVEDVKKVRLIFTVVMFFFHPGSLV